MIFSFLAFSYVYLIKYWLMVIYLRLVNILLVFDWAYLCLKHFFVWVVFLWSHLTFKFEFFCHSSMFFYKVLPNDGLFTPCHYPVGFWLRQFMFEIFFCLSYFFMKSPCFQIWIFYMLSFLYVHLIGNQWCNFVEI